MFIHKVNYVDFNGNERTEELHFHLAIHELTRIEAQAGVPLEQHIKNLTDNNKTDELLAFIEMIMLTSYGEKSKDGKSFIKTPEVKLAFEYSQAYAELFEQIITNKELANEFGTKVADKGKNVKNQVTPKVVEAKPTN